MSTPTDTQNHPAVKALAAHQDRLGLSGSRFAKRYLRCSEATWSQLKSGQYPADPAAWLEKCETALRLLEDEAAAAHQPGEGIIELAYQRRAIKLVRACYNEERDRLVLVLADTGGGKTTLATLLRDTLGDTVVVVEPPRPGATTTTPPSLPSPRPSASASATPANSPPKKPSSRTSPPALACW